MDWFYITTNKERVRFTEPDVPVLVRGGALRPDSMVWRDGMKEWLSASEVAPEWFRAPKDTSGGRELDPTIGDELDFSRAVAAALLGSGGWFVAAMAGFVAAAIIVPIPGVLFLVAAVKLWKARNRLARAEALGLKSSVLEGMSLLRQSFAWAASGLIALLAAGILLWVLSMVLPGGGR